MAGQSARFGQKEVVAVSEGRQPHRRRRNQTVSPIPEEEKAAAPHRIVAADEDTPDWMVSADSVSGAAERRGAPGAKPQDKRKTAHGRESDETRAVLDMSRRAAAEKQSETDLPDEARPRKKAEVYTTKAGTAKG